MNTQTMNNTIADYFKTQQAGLAPYTRESVERDKQLIYERTA